MDILFKNDDFVFSYRVGGILKHNGKILLQRPKKRSLDGVFLELFDLSSQRFKHYSLLLFVSPC